jgi:hypothetical protein
MAFLIIAVCAILLFMLLIYSLVVTCKSNKDGWVNYKQFPFGNIKTGAGNYDENNDNIIRPMSFYNYPIFRKPLNYPICHLVDYPIPHCRSDSL